MTCEPQYRFSGTSEILLAYGVSESEVDAGK